MELRVTRLFTCFVISPLAVVKRNTRSEAETIFYLKHLPPGLRTRLFMVRHSSKSSIMLKACERFFYKQAHISQSQRIILSAPFHFQYSGRLKSLPSFRLKNRRL